MRTGAILIAQERSEQIHIHGNTVEKDVINNSKGQLITAAMELLNPVPEMNNMPASWNNKQAVLKLIGKPYKERLQIAGALIAAELDRLNENHKGVKSLLFMAEDCDEEIQLGFSGSGFNPLEAVGILEMAKNTHIEQNLKDAPGWMIWWQEDEERIKALKQCIKETRK